MRTNEIRVAALEPLDVSRVHGILHDLHEVDRQHHPTDVAPDVSPGEDVIPRQLGDRARAEIPPHQAAEFLNRVGAGLDPIAESRFLRLGWLLEALTIPRE